jgi:hypothetical protein
MGADGTLDGVGKNEGLGSGIGPTLTCSSSFERVILGEQRRYFVVQSFGHERETLLHPDPPSRAF